MLFIFIDTASNEIYTLSLHDALPIWKTNCSVLIMHQDQIKSPAFQNAELRSERLRILAVLGDRKSTRLNSSHTVISYAVFCLKKKKKSKNLLYEINR